MTAKGREIEPVPNNTAEAFADMRETDEHVLAVAREAIDKGRHRVSRAAHSSMVETYWTIGRQITEAVGERAAYGRHLIAYLSKRLTAEYGRGFGERTLRDAASSVGPSQFGTRFVPNWGGRSIDASCAWLLQMPASST